MKLLLITLILAAQFETGCSDKSMMAPGTVVNDTTHPIRAVPSNHLARASQEGNVVRINYTTNSYTAPNTRVPKHAYVYLPYNYNADSSYNVFYLMHGGGGSAERYFNGEGQSSELKRILDNMIQNGELNPLIVVTPTFYPGNNAEADAGVATRNFPNELMNDLIPAVEGTYSTYATDTTRQALVAARTHRAFGGFSMGSVTTWYSFIFSLDYFKYFMPMSGDSWIVAQQQAGGSRAGETAEYLNNVVINSGYGNNDFFIYALTGTRDIAYTPMNSQIAAMRTHPRFIFSSNFSQGNIYYNVLEGGEHTNEYVQRYIYNALPTFWTRR